MHLIYLNFKVLFIFYPFFAKFSDFFFMSLFFCFHYAFSFHLNLNKSLVGLFCMVVHHIWPHLTVIDRVFNFQNAELLHNFSIVVSLFSFEARYHLVGHETCQHFMHHYVMHNIFLYFISICSTIKPLVHLLSVTIFVEKFLDTTRGWRSHCSQLLFSHFYTFH